jgi:NAD(P)-dependent dehydrogenase (short-subunit alcohol dehydrogenase family)
MHHTAIVTGGAQGIGRGITRRLIAAGWKVLVLDKDPTGLNHARAEFLDPDVCRFLRGDCGKPQTARRAIAVIQKVFGRLDLLVNNAGGSGFAPFEKQTPAGWHQAIDANLSSTFFFSQAAAPLLSLHKGAIVNIASTRALQSEPNSEAYAAAKGGVVALTHALAASLRHRVRVNAICPGWIDVSDPSLGPGRKPIKITAKDKTQHWCGRVGTPDDIADAVCYLAQATFVSGQILVVDGGMTKTMMYE